MDKKERNSLVKAKMTEVIIDENQRATDEAKKSLEEKAKEINNGIIVQQIRDMRKEHDKLLEQLKKTIEKEGYRNAGAYLSITWSFIGSKKSYESADPICVSYSGIHDYSHWCPNGDLMTLLVEHRNSKNKRISKVAIAGLKLIFDGDESTVKDFLAL